MLRKVIRKMQNIGGVLYRVETDYPCAALTFDDGPDPDTTPAYVELLSDYNVNATFFLVGKSAERNSDIVRMIIEKGHFIGNHSWEHTSFRSLPFKDKINQIAKCSNVLPDVGIKLFRPPYGELDYRTALWLYRNGYETVYWTVDGLDFLDYESTCIYKFLKNNIRAGSILLMHDVLYKPQYNSYKNRDHSLKALEMLLEETAGIYRYMTIPELMSTGIPCRSIRFIL